MELVCPIGVNLEPIPVHPSKSLLVGAFELLSGLMLPDSIPWSASGAHLSSLETLSLESVGFFGPWQLLQSLGFNLSLSMICVVLFSAHLICQVCFNL